MSPKQLLNRYPFFVIGLVMVLVGGAILLFVPEPVSDTENIVSDRAYEYGEELQFEIVDTPEARERGLSGRERIPDGYGMLFVFPEKDTYGFWMKDMLVSIDIIWLSDNGTVLGIERSVSPATYPTVFYPPEPVRYVLEVGAGYARERSWEVGSVIDLPSLN